MNQVLTLELVWKEENQNITSTSIVNATSSPRNFLLALPCSVGIVPKKPDPKELITILKLSRAVD